MLDISNIPWESIKRVENRNIKVFDSLSLKRSKLGKSLHREEWEFTSPPINEDDGVGEIEARMSRAIDDFELIECEHPSRSNSKGTIPSEGIYTNNNYAAGLKDIAFKSDGVWQLKAGDYFTFDSHTKLYRVSESTLLQSGVQVVKLTFGLRQSVSVNDLITANGVKITFDSGTSAVAEDDANDSMYYQLSYSLVEAL